MPHASALNAARTHISFFELSGSPFVPLTKPGVQPLVAVLLARKPAAAYGFERQQSVQKTSFSLDELQMFHMVSDSAHGISEYYI